MKRVKHFGHLSFEMFVNNLIQSVFALPVNQKRSIVRNSELTSVHVPYRNTRIFSYRYTNYRFTRFTQNTRFTREYEAISSASEMGIKITRRSLAGLQNISERDEMIDILAKRNWNKGSNI